MCNSVAGSVRVVCYGVTWGRGVGVKGVEFVFRRGGVRDVLQIGPRHDGHDA